MMNFRLFTAVSAAMLCLFISACSSVDLGPGSVAGSNLLYHDNTCLHTPSACVHKGRYEAGEAAYAAEQARRLNQASLARLKRISLN